MVAALALAPIVTPAPPAAPEDDAFSVARAFDIIGQIAREPRAMGTPGNERGRDFITAQLRVLGLEPEFQTITVPNYFSAEGENVEVVNVLARIPGTASTRAVALVGHHDTVPDTFGANDDASAVAVMLETARAVLAGEQLRNDVLLVFTDGEEPAPRFGSSAFVADHPWIDEIGFAINLEAIGTGGPSTLTAMNGAGEWVIDRYAEAVPYPAAYSFLTTTSELIGGSNTDFASFRDAGIPGLDVTYLRGSSIYHTAADAPDRVSLRSLHQHGANALALVRALGSHDLDPPRDGTHAAFFTVGRFVVRYPAGWSLPIALLAGAVLIAAGWRHRAWRGILRSLSATLVTALASSAVAVGIWTLLAGWRNTMGIAEGTLYLVGLIALAAGIGTGLARVFKRRVGTGPDALGVALCCWVLGLLTTLMAPGISPLFVWPALAAGVVVVARSPGSSGRWTHLVSWVVVSGTALVLSIPAIDAFFQLAQPRPGNPDSEILATILVPILLASLAIELLRAFRIRSPRCQPPTGQTARS